MTEALNQLKMWAKTITRDVHALYLVARDARTPVIPKIAAACVAAYALSPIDLIPDFIPVIGYLDDLILVPLGILLVVRLIPPDLLAEHRKAAALAPASKSGAIVIILIWLAISSTVGWILYRTYVS